MLQLKNETPFAVAMHLFPDARGVDTLLVAIKATFAIAPGAAPRLADAQPKPAEADVFWGAPAASSLRYAGEAHLPKPATDVLLLGHAHAPGGRRVATLDISLAVGAARRTVRIHGDRAWTGAAAPPYATDPQPFQQMPLVYERAFGGTHVEPATGATTSEPRNPVGRGFFPAPPRDPRAVRGLLLPNLEDPTRPLAAPGDRPPPACFGPVAPAWEPRRRFAGTYDAAWEAKRAPFLPEDFDPRFFNVAPPGLTCRGHLAGGEPVEVVHASPEGALRFALPRAALRATVRVDGSDHDAPPRLETVLIEPDDGRLSLLWRAAHPCGKAALRVREVRVTLAGLDLGGAR